MKKYVFLGLGLFSSTFFSLPTIAAPYGFYVEAEGVEGQSLKDMLGTIAARGQKPLSYSQVWQALKDTNEDPNNSDNVILYYSGRSQAKSYTASGSNDQNAWNREHIWPKSFGFKRKNQWGYTDLHHLQPTDVKINAIRSNKDFDYGGSPISKSPLNKTDWDSFEPRDEVKGDTARSIFYMAVRYDGNSGNMPDLYLVNDTSSSSGSYKMGKICTLLEWHNADPVDNWERQRHEKVVKWQGNRNPFIDNPKWVNDIYGDDC
ncbi:endonuclease I family protein [Veronia pacifica]|uniref:Ribonuclease n=1 Tax=Veronia pacifica TaxID=1080227 RepID=A0A1C3EBN2_9GAMM|nr:endonuclease [Veronia pacifica]ODA30610.1 ribonuclease [Veronia pacifica]